jgi:hypothetical protein
MPSPAKRSTNGRLRASAGSAMVVDAEEPPLRVFFGEGPTQMAPQVYQQRLAEWAEWAHVSKAAEGK